MEKEIICTVCPRGCHIQVEGERETVRQVTGYICKRGLEYATAEFTHPVRILTTTVKLFACMEVIRTAVTVRPVALYDVIVPDICGTGVDIVATKAVSA